MAPIKVTGTKRTGLAPHNITPTLAVLQPINSRFPADSGRSSDGNRYNLMGYDYGSIHVFVGDIDPDVVRSRVIERIQQTVPGRACTLVEEADRSIVVGPPGRWIFVGDTASGTDDGDPAAFDALAEGLSESAPTLAIRMSDSACVHLYLYHQRELVDRFGTGKFPFYPFDSEDEAASFRGVEQDWAPYALGVEGPEMLRSVWDSKHNANGIVSVTATVLGIDPTLAGCGFTIFDESDEIYYRDWLEDNPVLLNRFDEFHFLIPQEGG